MYEGIDFQLSEDDDELEGLLMGAGFGGLIKVTLILETDDTVEKYIHPSELFGLCWSSGVGEQVKRAVVNWGSLNARAYDMSFVPWERSQEYMDKLMSDVEGDW